MPRLCLDENFWAGRRVLVTGHTGFKGSWLSLWLQQIGAEVTGFARPPSMQPNLFEAAGVAAGMRSIIGDLRSVQAVKSALNVSRPEIVFHLGAQSLVRYSYDNPLETFETNVMGTAHVLEAARHEDSVRAVVIVTSDKCYENREWDRGYREEDAMGGHDPYSTSKGCAELVTASYRRSFFADGSAGIASVRAGNVIGGGDWSADRLIPDFARGVAAGEATAVRNPDSVRPWQHVADPLYGYLGLAQMLWHQPQALSEAWNFGPDEDEAQSVREIVEMLVSDWGARAIYPSQQGQELHEAKTLRLDCTKARVRLGWRPVLNTRNAVSWTIDWYKQHSAGHDMKSLTLRQLSDFAASASGG